MTTMKPLFRETRRPVQQSQPKLLHDGTNSPPTCEVSLCPAALATLFCSRKAHTSTVPAGTPSMGVGRTSHLGTAFPRRLILEA